MLRGFLAHQVVEVINKAVLSLSAGDHGQLDRFGEPVTVFDPLPSVDAVFAVSGAGDVPAGGLQSGAQSPRGGAATALPSAVKSSVPCTLSFADFVGPDAGDSVNVASGASSVMIDAVMEAVSSVVVVVASKIVELGCVPYARHTLRVSPARSCLR